MELCGGSDLSDNFRSCETREQGTVNSTETAAHTAAKARKATTGRSSYTAKHSAKRAVPLKGAQMEHTNPQTIGSSLGLKQPG